MNEQVSLQSFLQCDERQQAVKPLFHDVIGCVGGVDFDILFLVQAVDAKIDPSGQQVEPRAVVAGPAKKFVDWVWPVHALIQKVVDLGLRWVGGKSDSSSAAFMEKDFRDLVETGHQEGMLEESEKRLIHRVFQFGDQTSKNIMTPRSGIFALPLQARPGEILEALRQLEQPCVVVNVTSDKCYENKEWVWGYRENDPIGGHDPYSNSKACAELVTSTFRDSYFNTEDFRQLRIAVGSARAGNVIGGGDWTGRPGELPRSPGRHGRGA